MQAIWYLGIFLLALLTSACMPAVDPATMEPCAPPESWREAKAAIPEVSARYVLQQTQEICSDPYTYCEFRVIENGSPLGTFSVSVTYIPRSRGSAECLSVPGLGHTWYFNELGEPIRDFPEL